MYHGRGFVVLATWSLLMSQCCVRSEEAQIPDDDVDAPHHCSEVDEFTCHSGQCVPARWQCDLEADCTDGSDELPDLCSSIECRADHFSCGSAQPCIPWSWRCDGHVDCTNGHDESSETCGYGSCRSDEFMCSHPRRCITQRWVCDLDSDCEDGSDEADCQPMTCDDDHWQCSNQQCIPLVWRCDGDIDCHDNSDEQNCTAADVDRRTKLLDASASVVRPPTLCAVNQFRCVTSRECINEAWHCDGEDDCMDSSDEADCDGTHMCRINEFRCLGSGHCIPSERHCDGEEDCLDGSDEHGCTVVNCDPTTMFDCSRGAREKCILLALVCDKKDDCGELVDESPELCVNHTDACLENNGGCSHTCIDTYVSHICTCPQGYQLSDDARICEDVDECKIPGMCSQICENKKGGYKCSCHQGYEWDAADHQCRATGEEPFLLFANRHDLRELRLYSGNYHLLVDGQKSIIALDYDFAEKLVFWSDVATERISMTRLSANGTRHVDVLVNHDLSTPDGLAYDWIHKNLYWTDTGNNRIDMLAVPSQPRGDRVGPLMRKTLINTNLDEPRAIVVDPRDTQRYLYWTDWGNMPKIERSYLDGSARTELITSNLQWPNGLTIDYESNLLFWVDAKLHHIACSDLLGNSQRVIITSYRHLRHPFAITVFEDQVYWTDWEEESIFTVNKFADVHTDSQVTNVVIQLYAPMDLHVYHRLKQPLATNVCDKTNCSHICLARPAHRGQYSCHCPDHTDVVYELDKDKRTCMAGSISHSRSSLTAKHLNSDDDNDDDDDGSRQERIDPTEPSVGRIAGAVVAILLMIAIVLVIVSVVLLRCFIRKTVRTLNFDNPVYRKTTEDQVSLEKNQYQPTRSLPSTLEPLTAGHNEYV